MKTINQIVQEKFELNQSTKRFYIKKFSDFLDKYENKLSNYEEFSSYIRFTLNDELVNKFNSFMNSDSVENLSKELNNIIPKNYKIVFNVDKVSLNNVSLSMNLYFIPDNQLSMGVIYTSNKSRITLSYYSSISKKVIDEAKNVSGQIFDYIFSKK